MEIPFCVWIGQCCKTPKSWLDLSIELWNVCRQAVAKFSYVTKLLPKLSSPQPPPAVVCFFEASVLFSIENTIFCPTLQCIVGNLVILSRMSARFGVLLHAKIVPEQKLTNMRYATSFCDQRLARLSNKPFSRRHKHKMDYIVEPNLCQIGH